METPPDSPEIDLPDTDEPLQSAVWLVQDLAIAMPPVPGVYETRIEELRLGRLFGTDRSLLDLDTPGSIAAALEAGWPRAGLAFGYVARGTGGRWFYSLVSEQLILHVSLRLQHGDSETSAASAALVSQAHGKLERFLAQSQNYLLAISPDPLPDDAARRIIAFSDAEGVPLETHFTWSASAGLSAPAERDQYFADNAPSEAVGVERVIWG